ncbi:MAG: hypothetical protein IJO40_10840 [Thermoguttaceae bacterium]|nr:hypothetical protein [Thermoguttaceae bacterium]
MTLFDESARIASQQFPIRRTCDGEKGAEKIFGKYVLSQRSGSRSHSTRRRKSPIGGIG